MGRSRKVKRKSRRVLLVLASLAFLRLLVLMKRWGAHGNVNLHMYGDWKHISTSKYFPQRSGCPRIYPGPTLAGNCLQRCDSIPGCNTVNVHRHNCELLSCAECNSYNCTWQTQKKSSPDVYTKLKNIASTKKGYATLVCNEKSLYPALALAQSVALSRSQFSMHFVVADSVSASGVKSLKEFGEVFKVPVIKNPNSAHSKELARQLNYTEERLQIYMKKYPSANQVCLYTKLFVWLLPLEKVVYLDADVLVLQNIDELFDIQFDNQFKIAAVPDIAPPDKFNSGLFVIEPSTAEFSKLAELASRVPSWNGGDQGFLQTVYSGWFTSPSMYRLPYRFNAQTKLRVLYEASWINIYPAIRVIHFSPHKPWEDPFFEEKDYKDFTKIWWELLDTVGQKSSALKAKIKLIESSVKPMRKEHSTWPQNWA